MTATPPTADWLTRPRTIIGVWVGYIVFSLNQSYIWGIVSDRERAFTAPLAWFVATAIVWSLLTPVIIRFARAYRIDRQTWKRNVLLHLAGIIVVGLYDASADQAARIFTNLPIAFWPDYFRKLDLNAFYYVIIVGVTHAADYYELYRNGELRAAQLQSELRTSQLERLRAQLQPHFLFNTLNAVNALIYEDPRAADGIITRLAELLRMTLALGSAQEMSLAHELEFTRAYLDIQQTRMGPRLRVVIDVAEDTENARVPTFLLQPIVENAVIHGIAPLVRGGELRIQALREADRVVITVEDNGRGVRMPVRYGIGMSNVKERLDQLYDDAAALQIEPLPDGGTRCRIVLPYSAAVPEANALTAAVAS